MEGFVCYPSGMVKLSGRENYELWKKQVTTALNAVGKLTKLREMIRETQERVRYSQSQSLQQRLFFQVHQRSPQDPPFYVESQLTVFLLTSIEMKLHANLMGAHSTIHPVDLWNTVEKLYS